MDRPTILQGVTQMDELRRLQAEVALCIELGGAICSFSAIPRIDYEERASRSLSALRARLEKQLAQLEAEAVKRMKSGTDLRTLPASRVLQVG